MTKGPGAAAALCVVATAMSLCGAVAAQPIEIPPRDHYVIEVDVRAGTLRVEAALEGIEAGTKICLPSFGQRYGEQMALARESKAEKNWPEPPDESGCVTFAWPQSSLHVAYKLTIAPLDEGHVWVASSLSAMNAGAYLAFAGESLFLDRAPQGHRTRVCVRGAHGLQTPTTVSTLKTSSQDDCFEARRPADLVRSYWTFGRQRTITAGAGPMTWTLQTSSESFGSYQALGADLMRILSYYAAWLPEQTPSHVVIFLFDAPFDRRYRHGFARAGGVVLQLGAEALVDDAARRILLAHELFHLYNGENLRYAQADYAQTGWIREGMTQYVAMRALMEIGLLSEGQLRSWIARRMDSGDDSDYVRGFFLSLALDLTWRAYGCNDSVYGFWRSLVVRGGFAQPQTNDTIFAHLAHYSNFDFGPFFAMYVARRGPIPQRELLEASGYRVVEKPRRVYGFGLSYAVDVDRAVLRIERVEAGSAAWEAGLRAGDVVKPSRSMVWDETFVRPGRVVLEVWRGDRWQPFLLLPSTRTYSGFSLY